jgi:hypothetical protein
MKLLTEYVAHALQFKHLAADESDPKLKEALEHQALVGCRFVSS